MQVKKELIKIDKLPRGWSREVSKKTRYTLQMISLVRKGERSNILIEEEILKLAEKHALSLKEKEANLKTKIEGINAIHEEIKSLSTEVVAMS